MAKGGMYGPNPAGSGGSPRGGPKAKPRIIAGGGQPVAMRRGGKAIVGDNPKDSPAKERMERRMGKKT